MKKIRNLVIGGIESKVVSLVITSMLLVAAVFFTCMMTQNSVLTNLTRQTNDEQVASITGTTSEMLDSVITENMDTITGMNAMFMDDLFRDRAVGVQMVGEYAARLLEDADSVKRMPWQQSFWLSCSLR